MKGKIFMQGLVHEVFEKVVGRRSEILMIISALQAGRHLFLEGPPGTSKSTILRAISESMGTQFRLITGNSDLTTSKLVGYFDPAQAISRGYRPEYFTAGPLVQAMTEGMYLYVEEFNRLPDETTNVFVTVMSESRLYVPRYQMVESHPDFRIIAALNPLDDIGISRISRALKDRFCSFKMDYQPRPEEIEILKQRSNNQMEDTIELAVDMARETRFHPDLKLGASIRAGIDMLKIYSEAMNILNDSEEKVANYTEEEVLLKSAMMAFRNRIWLYETCEKTPEKIIEEIFHKVQIKKK
jgi:MoxR-like ATPase